MGRFSLKLREVWRSCGIDRKLGHEVLASS